MQIKVEDNGGITIYRMTGDIDINTSPDVKKSFDGAMKDKKEKEWILILKKTIGQDHKDKENMDQGSKEKGAALKKVDNMFYRPSS